MRVSFVKHSELKRASGQDVHISIYFADLNITYFLKKSPLIFPKLVLLSQFILRFLTDVWMIYTMQERLKQTNPLCMEKTTSACN